MCVCARSQLLNVETKGWGKGLKRPAQRETGAPGGGGGGANIGYKN